MKSIKILSLVAVFVATLYSCSREPGEMIVGEWKISEISTTNEIPAELKESHQQSLDEMKASYLLVIKADSTFDHTIAESTSSGKWKLSPDAKSLILTYDDGETEISNIVELTDKKLVTTVEFNDSKNTISFEKQEKK